ncbi:MAG: ABC transporter ATP-binding protein, partial [Moorea sp. SIO3C2]|nr:ABC transporter ATP-binding protein [Moorena sp. SIO3C2]
MTTSNVVLKIARSDADKLDTTRAVKKLFQRIFKYVWQNKLPFFFALVIIICLSIMQALIPQVTRYTIDVVIPTKQLNLLPWIVGAIFLISILTGVLNYGRTYLMSLFGERIIDSIRNDMYKHIQGLSISFFENQRTGDLMSRLAKDVNAIGTLVTADIAEILVDVFTVIVIIVYLLTTDWQLSLLLIFTWPLTIYMTQVFGKLMRGAYREVEEQAAAVNNHLQDTISNIQVIKSFGNERYEIDRFFEQSRSYMESNIRATRLWSIFFPVIDVLNNIGSAIVLVFGSWEVIVGRLTIGELAAFLAYVSQVNRPIRRFSKMIQLVQRALVGSERVFEILEMEPEVKEKEDAVVLTSVEGNLKFENVEFGYKEGETVLHDFTLEIKPGMTVALVGSSGAGKSTVAKLAARFYDPQKGKILIDDRNLRDISLDSLRSHLGIVSQETLLLYGTV